jgi:acetyl-CoA acyltransferase
MVVATSLPTAASRPFGWTALAMTSIVIAGYARSPFHFAAKGALARVRPDDLAAKVVEALIERTGVPPEEIEDVIVGCAFPEGEQGFNVGRLIALLAHLPITVAGATVNRFCGSSMQAVHMAAGAIRMEAGEAFVCAGIESMSRVPIGGFNPLPNPGLMEHYPQAYASMGVTAENVARQYQITRAAQEAFAVESHRKAAEARAEGRLAAEIVPIPVNGKLVEADGCIRPETSAEALAGLKPAFDQDGTVTAGTSSPLTDGAAACLVCTEDYARRHGLEPLARIRSIAVAGCGAEVMGIGPVAASRKALARAGLEIKDIEVVELNEAFASQAMACVRDLGIDEATLNIDGGAIALGHPLGATGARITGKTAQIMKREGRRFGLATQCIGGGQGIATVLEAL